VEKGQREERGGPPPWWSSPSPAGRRLRGAQPPSSRHRESRDRGGIERVKWG
jgi:hypothetical protein